MTLLFILAIIAVIIFIYLYSTRKINGEKLAIAILVIIILFILLSLGLGMVSLAQSVCMNKTCNVVKLPLDITKLSQYDSGNFLYRVVPLKGAQ